MMDGWSLPAGVLTDSSPPGYNRTSVRIPAFFFLLVCLEPRVYF
jgi:hypothetical protein